jgi:phage terminase large subunit-like protein
VENGNAKEVQELLSEFMNDSISIRDTAVKKEMKENYYHGLLLGLLVADGRWLVKSNVESGIGYTDILIEIPRKDIGCVMEVKYAEDGTFDRACEEAMKQIEDDVYAAVLERAGMQEIHKYGIACHKKSCKVAYREG